MPEPFKGRSGHLVPAALGLLTATFADSLERTRATAAYGAMAGIGSAVGLVLGRLVTSLLSWRVRFVVNLPIGLALIWATRRFVAPSTTRPGQLDVTGALLSTAGMVSLVYGIVRSADDGWNDPITLAEIGTGLLWQYSLVVGLSRKRAGGNRKCIRFRAPDRTALRITFLRSTFT